MDDAPKQSSNEESRRERHRLLCEASSAAFASPEFRRALDELKVRCALARTTLPRRKADIQFDTDKEREEGWAFEPIGNLFA